MRDVFAEQIMMICFAIFGRHDIYKFVEEINKLTKDPDKKKERQTLRLALEMGEESGEC